MTIYAKNIEMDGIDQVEEMIADAMVTFDGIRIVFSGGNSRSWEYESLAELEMNDLLESTIEKMVDMIIEDIDNR